MAATSNPIYMFNRVDAFCVISPPICKQVLDILNLVYLISHTYHNDCNTFQINHMDYQYHHRSAAAAAAYQGYHHHYGSAAESTNSLKVGY